MASGFDGNGSSTPTVGGATASRPPTGGGVTLDRPPTGGPTPGPPQAPPVSGFGSFTPVQGAGFSGGGFGSQSPGAGAFGLGLGIQPPPGGAVPPQSFLNTGQGGFSATPRPLTGQEFVQLNQDLGVQGTSQQFHPNSFRSRQLLGPLGFIADPSTFNRGQVPFIETRLNFENLLQAQQDRAQAINLLQEQRGQIGQRPEQQQALAVATRRLAQPEPFTPEEVSQQQSAIRQRGAQGLEAAQRQQQESLARQGVRGGVTAFQEATQRQTAGRQTSDELQRLAIENALGRDVNEAQAVDRLRQIGGEDEARTIAVNNLLTELLSAQRGEFDLSALTAKERKSERGLLSKIGFF